VLLRSSADDRPGCYKTKFSVPAGDGWSTVTIPFTAFSDKWSPATGEQTSTCANETDVCPTASALAGIKRIEFWAEGVDGHVRRRHRGAASALPRVPPPRARARTPPRLREELVREIASSSVRSS
jgi:hypothetical protein